MVRRRAAWLGLVVAWGCAGDDTAASGGGTSTGASSDVDTAADDVEPDSDTGSECGASELACDGACVDPQTDDAHCGDCDTACEGEAACVSGECVLDCGEALACGGACVDPQTDAAHCGGCGQTCTDGASCIEGQCVVECGGSLVACGGACVDPSNDEAHCGDCGQPCAAGSPCVYGQCVDAALHHILISGQSLSVGATSAVVSTEQPYDNVSFNTGVRAGGANLTSFIPLVETAAANEGETIASGMSNLTTDLAEDVGFADWRTLASCNGLSGTPYSGLAKGTAPYADGIAQVQAGVDVATAAGLAYAMRAVTVIHGESDHIGNNPDYAGDLLQWQADYEADIQAITGQTAPLPMLLCQMSSHTAFGSATSAIPIAQLDASRTRPDRIMVVGPKYFLEYTDGVHLTGESMRRLGEYYAKVYRHVLIEGEHWTPLAPREVTRDGAVIRVAFDVPEPPLVFDMATVSDPGDHGFEYTDDSGAPPGIASFSFEGSDTVVVTLDAEPTGDDKRIRYAYTGVPGQPAGPTTGARGNLRDSDATQSLHGYDLFNWAVHFDEPVP